MVQWKDIEGYEGLYKISNSGDVLSVKRYKNNHNALQLVNEKLKTTHISNSGYYYVILWKDNKSYMVSIHRLVAKHFIPNPENKPQVNHIDGDKSNNCVNNLEWVTCVENMEHAIKNGLYDNKLKKIDQYNTQGELIKTWESSMSVEKKLGYCNSNIIRCCKGRCKTAYGYIWKYH